MRRRSATPSQRSVPLIIAAALILIPTIWLWSLSSPVMSAPDEPMHTIWARALVTGNWSETVVDSPVGRVAEVSVTRNLKQYKGIPSCYAFQPTVDASCAAQLNDDESASLDTTSFSTYPPTYYALVGAPLVVRTDEVGVRASRMLSGVIAGLLLAWAFEIYTRDRGTIGVAGFSVTLTPMIIYLGGVVNPSGLEIASAIVFWCAVLTIVEGLASNDTYVATAVGGSVFALSRPMSPFLIAFIAVTIVAVYAPRSSARRFFHMRRFWFVSGAVGLASVMSLIWTVVHDTSGSLLGYGRDDLSVWDALQQAVRRTGEMVVQMIGKFGWLDSPMPIIVTMIWVALILLLLVGAIYTASMARQRVALIVTVMTVLILNIAIDVWSYRSVGLIGQGRYVLPLAVGIPLMAASVMSTVDERRSHRYFTGVVVSLTVGGSFVAWWQMLRRFVHGLGNGSSVYPWGTDGWRPPLEGRVLIGIAIVLGALWWALQIGLVFRRPPTAGAGASCRKGDPQVGPRPDPDASSLHRPVSDHWTERGSV